jgi:osmotically-inducible protein OsmY
MRIPFVVVAAAAGSLLYFSRRKKLEPVADDVLIVRARAALEGLVQHPGSIDIQVRDGHLTLHGPIAEGELKRALRALRKLPGVRRVVPQLTVHH